MKFDDAEQLLKAADADGLRRVLVVTALAIELKAVMAHLKLLGSCTARDGNIFEFGRFSGTAGDWLVVVGESGAGNHQAQAMVTTALNEFGGFDLMLFVGVTSHEAVVFLAHAHWTVPNFVHEVLLEWSKNPSSFVQQAFGEIATLVWLMQPALKWAEPIVEGILKKGASPARTGATYAAVHVWAEVDKNDRASVLLERVIRTADADAWSAVVDLFRIVDELTPAPEWMAVLEAIADQIPLQSKFNSSFVVERLQTLLPHHASLVAKISLALASKWGEEMADMRTGTAAIAPELVDIAITLHRLGPQTRQAGLELFEKLLTINAYTARETLDQIDNRFRDNAPSARVRLPRRNRRLAKRTRRAARN